MTMTSASYAVTGPVIAGDSTESIRNGTLGNLLNMVGAKHVHEMQRIAVEESRLRIPLMIGFDVIHGHRTIFPVPLAEAATFEPRLWELTAREAARETAADGLAMTFAPMLDVLARSFAGAAPSRARARTRGSPCRSHAPKSAAFRARISRTRSPSLRRPSIFARTVPVMGGRDYASVDISERTLREVHLPAFAAAVDAGVRRSCRRSPSSAAYR
jgi:beta-glucosidase